MAPIFTGSKFGFGRSAAVAGGGSTPITASGGNVNALEPGNGYVYHTFTSPGTFTVTSGTGNVELFLIGGGGAGSSAFGGGGGAGALIYRTSVPVTSTSYPIVIGDGGEGSAITDPGSNPTAPATNWKGANSTALGFTAAGGGGGTAPSPYDGGSGGGELAGPGAPTSPGGTASGAPGHPTGANIESPPVGWGNPGGVRSNSRSSGGGGAGSAGGPTNGGTSAPYPNFAGPLIGVPALGPLSGAYAGGGGGGASTQFGPNTVGSGGGGGATAGNVGGWPGGQSASATANTGSGSGGGGHAPGDAAGSGSGGLGICVIRYLA